MPPRSRQVLRFGAATVAGLVIAAMIMLIWPPQLRTVLVRGIDELPGASAGSGELWSPEFIAESFIRAVAANDGVAACVNVESHSTSLEPCVSEMEAWTGLTQLCAAIGPQVRVNPVPRTDGGRRAIVTQDDITPTPPRPLVIALFLDERGDWRVHTVNGRYVRNW